MNEKAPLAENVRKLMRELGPLVETMATAFTSLTQSDQAMAGQVADLTRRQSEAEERAQRADQQVSDLIEKDKRSEKINVAARALIEAVNRLPETMEEAHLIPGANRPAVPLYGTYEWRAVIDAKFLAEEAMKEKRVL